MWSSFKPPLFTLVITANRSDLTYPQALSAPSGSTTQSHSSAAADVILENQIEATLKIRPKCGLTCDWAWKAEDIFLEWTHFLEDVHEFHKFLYSIHDTIQWSELNIEKSSHHISWCLFVNYWNPQYSVLKTICLRPLSPLHTRQAHYHCHSLEKSCILLHRPTCYKKNFNTLTSLSSQMAINTTLSLIHIWRCRRRG